MGGMKLGLADNGAAGNSQLGLLAPFVQQY